MRTRVVPLMCVVALGVGLFGAGMLAYGPVTPATATWVHPSRDAVATQPPEPEPRASTSAPIALAKLALPADPRSIKVSGAWLFGWTLVDRQTGKVAGSTNSASVTNTVESMIKPWIASDYLRRLAEADQEPSPESLKELTLMIVDSNDPMAEKYFRKGGSDAVVRRLITICGLTRVRIKPTLWSWAEMTPRDAARYGACLGDGRAAGPQWTKWVLETMRHVRGEVGDGNGREVQGGRWGIIDGLPPELARDTSIKNGWTLYKDGWHVNCLAVHPAFVLTVMIRTTWGLRAAADMCESVAARLVVNP
jgi:hypothetical protein